MNESKKYNGAVRDSRASDAREISSRRVVQFNSLSTHVSRPLDAQGNLAKVYSDKGWDSTQATVLHLGRRRYGVSWRVGLDIAAIVGSRYPVFALANEILNEAAELIAFYVNPRN